jgi:hypothetical protein
VTAQCQFKPYIGFIRKLPRALEQAEKIYGWTQWNVNAQRGVLREPQERSQIIADHRTIQLQTLGLAPWIDERTKHDAAFNAMLKEYSVVTCSRLRFEFSGFYDLGMPKSEVAELFFTAFLSGTSVIEPICPSPKDALLRIFGKTDGKDVSVTIAPMSKDEVLTDFLQIQNVMNFRGDDPFDAWLTDWRNMLARDCCFISVEVILRDTEAAGLSRFFTEATKIARQAATDTIRTLKALPLEGRENL